MGTVLDRLFGDAAVFVDHYRRRDVLHHRTAGFDDLFDVETADRLVGAGVLQVPFDARMANADGDAGATTAERWREAMRGTSPKRFDPDVAVAGFDAGDTIVLHALHQRVPAIDRFANELEQLIGQMIDVNAFLTPPNAQGLDVHYDHHDVMILQVLGSKTWRLWPTRVDDPLPEFSPEQFTVEGEPREVILDVGDVLYLPRGWGHAATTGNATSLHLTVGIIPIPWLEVAQSFLSSLDREELLRGSLPLGFHREPSLLTEGITQTVALVKAIIGACNVEVAAKELAESFNTRRSTRVGRLAEVVAARDPLRDEMRVRLGSQAERNLRRGADRWQLAISDVVCDLPVPLEARLRELDRGTSLTLAEVIGPLDDRSAPLARQLLRHGILAVEHEARS